MSERKVVRKIEPLTKHDAKRLMAQSLLRMVSKHGKGTVSDAMLCTPRTVENAMAMTTLPELDTVLNSLTVDPSALDEMLAHFGLRAVPIAATVEADGRLLADTAGLAAAMAGALADGVIDHQEEQALAKLARPVASEWAARVAVADRKRA